MIMEHIGVTEESKTCAKHGYKEEVITEGELEMEQLNVEEQQTCRALAARLNYIAQDDPCIQFPEKEAFRSMLCPIVSRESPTLRISLPSTRISRNYVI